MINMYLVDFAEASSPSLWGERLKMQIDSDDLLSLVPKTDREGRQSLVEFVIKKNGDRRGWLQKAAHRLLANLPWQKLRKFFWSCFQYFHATADYLSWQGSHTETSSSDSILILHSSR